MSEVDARHYSRMLNSLNAYQAGEIGLSRLIADTEGVLNALEPPPYDLKNELWPHVNDFELVNAMALNRTPPGLNEQDKKYILETVEKLKVLVEAKLK